ncbi:MAG: hypothetical protein QOH31_1334 [Verrucomicrobiota bacterium]|jgi:hypothetical protein
MHANQGLGGNGFLYWCEFASIRGSKIAQSA